MGNSLSNPKLEKEQQPNLFFTTNDDSSPVVNIAKINNTVVFVSVKYNETNVAFSMSKVLDDPQYHILANYIENCLNSDSNIIITSNMFENKVLYSKEKLCMYMNMIYGIMMLPCHKFLPMDVKKLNKDKIW